MYKTKLPMILVFNKTDVKDASFAKEWMTDFEAFQAALREEEENGGLAAGGDENGGFAAMGSGYMGSLLHSMSLVLEEFYNHLSVVGVSSMTGEGVDDFFDAVQKKKEEQSMDTKEALVLMAAVLGVLLLVGGLMVSTFPDLHQETFLSLLTNSCLFQIGTAWFLGAQFERVFSEPMGGKKIVVETPVHGEL